jgi:hypothetical protein
MEQIVECSVSEKEAADLVQSVPQELAMPISDLFNQTKKRTFHPFWSTARERAR